MSGSKLEWYKSPLRGADLTDAEFRVLVILAGYSNGDMANAHPGVGRLVTDTGLSRRGVQDALQGLTAKGAIVLTAEGGNQVSHGAANVYQILTPPPRGRVQPLHPKGATTALKGRKSRQGKGATDDTGRVQPVHPIRSEHQVNNHPSGGTDAAAPAHTDGDSSSKSVVAGWLAAQPHRPPKHVVDQIAGHVQQLLEVDHFPADQVAEALTAWQARGKQPASLPGFVHEISRTHAQPSHANVPDPHEPRCNICQQPESHCRRINSNPKMPDRHDFTSDRMAPETT